MIEAATAGNSLRIRPFYSVADATEALDLTGSQSALLAGAGQGIAVPIETTGNERLVAVLTDLLATMQRFFFLGLESGDFAAEMRDEHEELVALLAEGEGDRAAACLRSQISASRDRILQALIDNRIDLPLE